MKQITQPSGRYYEEGGIYYPSMTTILGQCYPKGDFLQKWIGEVGNEEAERQKKLGGDNGTAVHEAIERMIKGGNVASEKLNEKQKKCLVAFLNFWEMERPQIIATEFQVKNVIPSLIQDGKLLRFAGSVDFKCRIRRDNYQKVWIIDWKTSNSVQAYFPPQIAGYIKADGEAEAGAIIHLGNKTKAGWSFIPVDVIPSWKEFQVCLEMFYLLHPNPGPKKEIEYPEIFSLPIASNQNQAEDKNDEINISS